MQLVVDSLLTHYKRSGKGKVILLLHGWGDNLVGLKRLQAFLSRNYDVISLDLPGFGNTEPPAEPWGLDNYGLFIRNFLNKLEVTPYAIIGHSNGGAISIKAVSKGYLRTEKLILLASSGIRNQYKGRKKALRLMAKAGKLTTMPLPKAIRYRLRRHAYKTIGSDMFVAEHLQDSFKKIVSDDVQEEAKRIRIPTLLIYGDRDEQTPLKYGETFHRLIPESKLEIVPNTGHFLLQEQPVVIERLIEEFIV